MPTYVYKFIESGKIIEVQQAFTDDPFTSLTDPSDGQLRAVKKVFTPVGVSFKGDGFYKTDSRSKSTSSSANATAAASNGSESSSNGDSTASVPAASSTESSNSPTSTPATTSTTSTPANTPSSTPASPTVKSAD